MEQKNKIEEMIIKLQWARNERDFNLPTRVLGSSFMVDIFKALDGLELKPQEPLYLLRGSDPAAPATLQVHINNMGMAGATVDQQQEVADIRFRFTDWQRINRDVLKL